MAVRSLYRGLTILFTALLVGACATPSVRTEVTRFHDEALMEAMLPGATGEGARAGASFAVVAKPDVDAESLEFKHHADVLARQLTALGFAQAEDPDSAEMRVALGYRVGDGQVITVSKPGRVVVIPRLVRTSSGAFVWVRNRIYFPPTEKSYLRYTRIVEIDMAAAEATAEEPSRIFEARAISHGPEGQLTAVIEPIIVSMLSEFPGGNGETRVVTVRAPAEEGGQVSVADVESVEEIGLESYEDGGY